MLYMTNERYESARKIYQSIGVDTEAALERLKNVPVSMHCWQGDDVIGFDSRESLSGGIQTTGNYPGRAATPEQLMQDISKVLTLVPGKKKLNLHASYAIIDDGSDRDSIKPKHFTRWVEFAKKYNMGIDFNPTFFSHRMVKDGLTLSSPDEEVRKFWIEHGKAPKNGTYEYLVWIQPTDLELKEHEALQTYEVLQRNDSAHIVHDRLTNITAYAVFETYRSQRDSLLSLIPAETMVMYRRDKANIIMSVCDPNLNIEEKAYTTKNPSRVLKKRLELKGKWKISIPNEKVILTADGENTILTVHCQHGQPVEFSLQQN